MGFSQAMWYQVVIYLLVLILLFRLPKVNPRQLAALEAIAPEPVTPDTAALGNGG